MCIQVLDRKMGHELSWGNTTVYAKKPGTYGFRVVMDLIH